MKETKTAKSTVRQEFGRIWGNGFLVTEHNYSYGTRGAKAPTYG